MSCVPKVAIIGAGGAVGAAVAYALVCKSVPAEIIMVDVAEQLVQGQADDISDAANLSFATCKKGSYADAGKCDVIVITAGARQKPGEPRSNLIDRNYNIIKSIIDSLQPINPKAKILMVSNPVDVLTAIAQKVSGLPKAQVIGSGTFLDSGRLRQTLSAITGVNSNSIHAYMLGEHGDNQFVGWSSARIAGCPLVEHPKLKGTDLDKIREHTMRRAYEIIEAKGATNFGVGMHVAVIVESLLNNSGQVFPVVCFNSKYNTYVSWPASIGSDGVEQVLNVPLDKSEQEKMDKAVAAIKEGFSKYE